jgi:Raf kinase inhibitor-like YbhB/YbcL family protein
MSSPALPPLPYDFLKPVPTFTVTSTDAADDVMLNEAHLFNGAGMTGGNLSPQLTWKDFSAETQSFAVTCYDPDAPTGSGFWHWVLFDIPVSVTDLPTGAGSGDKAGLPDGAIHARNDFGTYEFGGAAPPPGDAPHRYVFAVHALGTDKLGPDADASPAYVGFNINAHVIGRALLVPIFGR